MDAMDEYIKRLGDPGVRMYWNGIHHFDDSDAGADPGLMTTRGELTLAEEALGVALPPSYRKLVTTTRPEDGVYFVRWVDPAGLLGADIVSTRRSPEANLPRFLIAVHGFDDGNQYCFDTRHPDGRGEYPIVFFDREVHHEDSTEFETVAGDLGEHLLGYLGGETPA